jgi:hypothetical protein
MLSDMRGPIPSPPSLPKQHNAPIKTQVQLPDEFYYKAKAIAE